MQEKTIEVIAKTRIRNNTMIRARNKLGLSQDGLAKKAGVTPRSVACMESFDYSRTSSVEDSIAISVALEIDPDIVMPIDSYGTKFESNLENMAKIETNQLQDLKKERFLLPSPSLEVEKIEDREKIEKLLRMLTYRQREVIKLRYGLMGSETYTYEEVARIFKLSRERVRQVESKAILELRSLMEMTTPIKKLLTNETLNR